MMFPNDPVGLGLVDSLRRPGRNITGTTMSTGSEIFAKQLQMLKEAVPRASRLAILSNPADASFGFQMKELEAASRALGVNLQHVQARGLEELKAAFASMINPLRVSNVLGCL